MNERIVFFDGVCNLCNEAVDIIVRNDSEGKLKIASLQGESAKKYLSEAQIKNLNSLIFWEEGQTFDRSTGALKIAFHMDFPWKFLIFFLIVPRILRDPLYDLIAKYRYKLFGKKDSCRLPTEREKQHFLS